MQSHISVTLRLLVMTALTYFSLLGHGAEDSFKGVLIQPKGGKLRVEINGLFFSEYHYQEVSRPFFYPVMGPDGLPMTRNWPMSEGEGEEHDHPHHKSFWYAHGEINGHDFWSESSQAGTTRPDSYTHLTLPTKA